MSRLARKFSNSGIYHIAFRGVNQQSIFEEEADYKKLKDCIELIKEEMKFEIYAYCFMSNHVHIILKEKELQDISLIMKRILTKYARWYNIKYGRSGALIANRYKSVPVELDEYFIHVIRYVHQNPLKAGIVQNLEEYPYSSYGEYLNGKEITDIEFVLDMIDREEFRKFHMEEGEFEFKVTDSTKKSDEDIRRYMREQFGIIQPKDILNMSKEEKIKILSELKKEFSARQLQRVTGVSRGLIGRIEEC